MRKVGKKDGLDLFLPESFARRRSTTYKFEDSETFYTREIGDGFITVESRRGIFVLRSFKDVIKVFSSIECL
jgi:hypothetical protein